MRGVAPKLRGAVPEMPLKEEDAETPRENLLLGNPPTCPPYHGLRDPTRKSTRYAGPTKLISFSVDERLQEVCRSCIQQVPGRELDRARSAGCS
jgi:hypothetical protein